MVKVETPPERLSDYERAMIYHTLPRLVHPVTFGLIVAYTLCLAEAIGLLVYGLVADSLFLARLGSYAVFAIVVLGVVMFLARALTNEFRTRRLLAGARLVPDADTPDGWPDPFEDHILLRHASWAPGDLFPCINNDGDIVYFVETDPQQPLYRVKDPHDNELLRIQVLSGAVSFLIGGPDPCHVAIYKHDTLVARITRRFNLATPTHQIECLLPAPRKFRIRHGGIYNAGKLVGRVYHLRQGTYLDIRKDAFNDGILGWFVTLK